MDTPKTTPKDFFLWAGAMVTLYASVVACIALVFDYINYTFPDTALSYYVDPYQGGISYEMAALIVLAPVFLILMRLIRRDIEREPARNGLWIRRWALFLVLFVAGASIAVDLIVLLTAFLNGEELTTRFLLKVVVVLLIAAAGFMHFLADVWGYWTKFPVRARTVSLGVGVLVLVVVASGFFIVGTPNQARQMRLDSVRVADLNSLQSQVGLYYQYKQKLPTSLHDLQDPLSGMIVPTDPSTKQPYEYRLIDAKNFELCATFNAPSNTAMGSQTRPMAVNDSEENWQHGAGRTCFTRGPIDPQRYPPMVTPAKPF